MEIQYLWTVKIKRFQLKKTIFIIRHGQTDYNLQNRIQGRGIDAPLNATGEWQSRCLAVYLGAHAFSRIHTSSLIRTQQTAQPTLQRVGGELISSSDLDEMDFGAFEGVSFSELTKDLSDLLARWDAGDGSAAPKGGESPEQVFQRADAEISRILRNSDEEKHIFILHGRLIRILISQWFGLGYEGMSSVLHSNTSVNVLEWNPFNSIDSKEENLVNGTSCFGRFSPIALNLTEHLKSPAKPDKG